MTVSPNMPMLDKISKADLIQFLSDCTTVTEIDTDLALQIATSHIQAHDGREFNPKHLKRITDPLFTPSTPGWNAPLISGNADKLCKVFEISGVDGLDGRCTGQCPATVHIAF